MASKGFLVKNLCSDSRSGSVTNMLCVIGQATIPLWASVKLDS